LLTLFNMKSIIEVNNLGKEYVIGERQSYVALRDVLMNVLKSPLQLFQKNKKDNNSNFWALKDINFEVQPGEIIGVIGKNGAGKSTLLKVLSQITPPSTGEIKLRGRVGSLLEVGTGFHPELTGRENIFLNGAILGMTKVEIKSKYDEIVEFSGVEKFIDTPVKRYSSGMYVRLAFAVAAHMDPEILVVDEVLSVGDAEFQKKCLGKMNNITKQDGRTILFVSHNLGAIKQLCTRTIWLEDGKVKLDGPTEKVVSKYLQSTTSNKQQDLKTRTNRKGDGSVTITNFEITNENNYPTISSGDSLKLKITLSEKIKNISLPELKIAFMDSNDTVIFRIDTGHIGAINADTNTITIKTKSLKTTPSYFTVNAGLFINNSLADYIQNITDFEMESSKLNGKYTREEALLIIEHSVS
jgi:lipopolysaccharide transport system ATP-binding protein